MHSPSQSKCKNYIWRNYILPITISRRSRNLYVWRNLRLSSWPNKKFQIFHQWYLNKSMQTKYSRFDLYLTLEWPGMTFWHQNIFNLTPNLASLSNFASKYMNYAGIMVNIHDLTFWWPLYDLKWPWNIFFWIIC